jgi:hypothetical protein
MANWMNEMQAQMRQEC